MVGILFNLLPSKSIAAIFGCLHNAFSLYLLILLYIKDNLFKSSTWDGIYSNYYSREWIVENNTFDGDDDQRYGVFKKIESWEQPRGTSYTDLDICD